MLQFRSTRAMTMTDRISLPARLDGASVEIFTEALLARRAQPLTIDAAQVEFVGTLGIQVLIASRRQWQADGVAFEVVPVSGAVRDVCRRLGIDPSEFGGSVDAEEAR